MQLKRSKLPYVVLAVLLVPSAVAHHGHDDGDPLGQNAEHFACGSAFVRMGLEALEGEAGECDEDTLVYSHPLFGDGVTCDGENCRTQVVVQTGIPLNDEIDVEEVPLPPIEIPEINQTVGPFGETLVTVEGFKNDDPVPGYCVLVTPEFGPQPPPVCINSGLLHDLAPDTGGHSIGEVEERTVTTDPVEEGDLGSAPPFHQEATTLDVEVVAHWNQDLLHPVILATGLAEIWMPVDPEAPNDLLWWAENGEATRIEATWTWRGEDGAVLDQDTQSIGYLGQVFAALARSP